MRRNLFSCYTLFTITRGGWTWPTGCAQLAATPTPWTGSSRKGSTSPASRDPYLWTGGTRWEVWEWREQDIYMRWGGNWCLPWMEVSPAQRHPASQQGGRGWSITRMEEPGGRWRLEVLDNPFKFIQGDLISINLWAVDWRWNTQHHVPVFSRIEKGEDCFAWKWKFLFCNCLVSNTCELWIGRPALCTSFQPSWGGWDEQNESESFITHIDFLVGSCGEYQCLIRSWGRKYSYDDSINWDIAAFSCSPRSTNKHHEYMCGESGKKIPKNFNCVLCTCHLGIG